MRSPELIIAALVVLCVVGAVFTVRLRGRSKGDSQKEVGDRSRPNKFDTTLGEFHHMREALRPLQHTRAASRKVPGQRE
jgi:hypothetical protein